MNYLRALICEWLVSLAMRVCPDNYVPSFIEAMQITLDQERQKMRK